MGKTIGRVLFIAALLLFFGTWCFCNWTCLPADKTCEILTGILALEFFIYKLLTGWLIINLTVKVEPTREHSVGSADHLVLKLTLTKGANDSLWLKDILIRISEVTSSADATHLSEICIVHPVGKTKRKLDNGNYWNGKAKEYYTISSGEEVVFSAYAQVEKNMIIAVEVLVLGTRLFYGIESRTEKLIQWRSSVIILPVNEKKSN